MSEIQTHLMLLLKDTADFLAEESEQRAHSGNDEDRADVEALIKRIGDTLSDLRKITISRVAR